MGVLSFDKSFLGGRDIHIHSRHKSVGFEMHRHEYFEMIYYNSCRGITRINGTEYKISGECIFLLTPTDFHEIIDEGDADSHSVVVAFTESVIDEALFSGGAITPSVIYSPDAYLAATFNKMYEIYKSSKDLREISHLINYSVCAITKDGAPVNRDSSYVHPKIREAITYVMANLDSDSSLECVAGIVGLSPSYFSAKFSEVMKKPYKLWLKEAKIARAKRLLESTDEPIINISYECGYNNTSHFIKVFGSMTGCTPKTYRKIHKN